MYFKTATRTTKRRKKMIRRHKSTRQTQNQCKNKEPSENGNWKKESNRSWGVTITNSRDYIADSKPMLQATLWGSAAIRSVQTYAAICQFPELMPNGYDTETSSFLEACCLLILISFPNISAQLCCFFSPSSSSTLHSIRRFIQFLLYIIVSFTWTWETFPMDLKKSTY